MDSGEKMRLPPAAPDEPDARLFSRRAASAACPDRQASPPPTVSSSFAAAMANRRLLGLLAARDVNLIRYNRWRCS
ncbi:Os11g0224466 [Oryza sativa Japonica Group]|uniref:Os11g0224466 protein n=1 Tax=Oryza sativa subsp. japonica TaxID=39947 RepID=A0A0P0Y0L0_ORYSJ|nr:Os11g0224466 [Oryza sativa Japonica Group]